MIQKNCSFHCEVRTGTPSFRVYALLHSEEGYVMTEGMTGSTVPRRQLGRYLRDLRNRSRLTVRAAATELEWSEAKIWRIETGQTGMRSLDVETMCRIYVSIHGAG
jgi:hypothetical protein